MTIANLSRTLPWILIVLMAGCSSQRDLSADPQVANAVAISAMSQVGAPYRYGGNSPRTGFDCSGLIGYVYLESAGIQLPRTVSALRRSSSPGIDRDELQTGDVVIFATGFTRKADHAGIYVGKNRFVHAPSRGGKVRLDTLGDDYWDDHYLTAKRLLIR